MIDKLKAYFVKTDGPDGQPTVLFWPLFILVFLSLIIINCQSLFRPAYWDGCVGVFRQGAWLAANQFNITELLEQPKYYSGPNFNVFYIFSYEYALLIKLLPTQFAFLILHLQNFAFAAFAVVTGTRIAVKYVNFQVALIWLVAGLFQPIMSGQIAAIYVEIPLAAMAVWALYHYLEKNYIYCAVICLLGLLVKSTIVLLCVSFLFFELFRLFVWVGFRRKNFEFAFAGRNWKTLTVFSPLLIYAVRYRSLKVDHSLEQWWYFAQTNFPILLVVLASISVLLCASLMIRSWREKTCDVKIFDTLLLLIIFCLGFACSHAVFPNALPRYWCFIILPLSLLWALTTYVLFGARVSIGIAVVWLGISLFNQFGAFYPSPFIAFSRDGSELERSREYLEDQRQQLEICQFIEKELGERKVLVQFPFNLLLTSPELGYVTKSCAEKIISVDDLSDVPCDYVTEDHLKDRNLLLLYVPSKFELSGTVKFAPTSRSRYIKQWTMKNRSPIILFENNVLVRRMKRRR